jgi:hypothetical protein
MTNIHVLPIQGVDHRLYEKNQQYQGTITRFDPNIDLAPRLLLTGHQCSRIKGVINHRARETSTKGDRTWKKQPQ